MGLMRIALAWALKPGSRFNKLSQHWNLTGCLCLPRFKLVSIWYNWYNCVTSNQRTQPARARNGLSAHLRFKELMEILVALLKARPSAVSKLFSKRKTAMNFWGINRSATFVHPVTVFAHTIKSFVSHERALYWVFMCRYWIFLFTFQIDKEQ